MFIPRSIYISQAISMFIIIFFNISTHLFYYVSDDPLIVFLLSTLFFCESIYNYHIIISIWYISYLIWGPSWHLFLCLSSYLFTYYSIYLSIHKYFYSFFIFIYLPNHLSSKLSIGLSINFK